MNTFWKPNSITYYYLLAITMIATLPSSTPEQGNAVIMVMAKSFKD